MQSFNLLRLSKTIAMLIFVLAKADEFSYRTHFRGMKFPAASCWGLILIDFASLLK